jgi:hypothetical protein
MSAGSFDPFLKFRFPFRTHQNMILERFNRELAMKKPGEPLRFHVVAPPGSGKTIVGIELAIRLRRPSLIVCPNTAIQGQWVKKIELFMPENSPVKPHEIVTADARQPRFVNVLTYQILSMPEDAGETMIELAEGLWARSISQVQGISLDEARARVEAMKAGNHKQYKKELSKYTKGIRDGKLLEGDAESGNKDGLISVLHPNTREILIKLKNFGVKTVVFDECHHLQTYWAVVMRNILEWMGVENIIGLTATPPLDEKPEILQNYMSLLGDVDFQIPTSAVVKDGMLAPYQDMTYFCLPRQNEMEYLKNCHQKFRSLIEGFKDPNGDFCAWMVSRIIERRMADGSQRDWRKLFASRPEYSAAGVKYLRMMGIRIPPDITLSMEMAGEPSLEDWALLIEDYALNRLKLSSDEAHRALYDSIRDALYTLGFILTEKGIRTYISPLDRVLSYSKNKLTAVKDILRQEMRAMGDKLRAAVVTDFEYSNSLSLQRLENVLDDECGGAISVIKELVSDPELDTLDPVMVTGKSLLCDDDIAETYVKKFYEWAREAGYDITLSMKPVYDGKLCEIEGSGKDWNTKSAVLFTTSLLDKGIIKCIVGTRGLLGEGWDSISLNTMIDLCCAATYASVNQLRGRSIRKDDSQPRKLANNWDVVAYAPGLEKGSNDFNRLLKKHKQFYSICEDGRIQKGADHIDPSLPFLAELDTDTMNRLNERMMKKSLERPQQYDKWRIGEKFVNKEQDSFEFTMDNNAIACDTGVYTLESGNLAAKSAWNKFKSGAGVIALLAAVAAAGISLPVTLACGAVSALFLYSAARGTGKAADYSQNRVMTNDSLTFARKCALCLFSSLKDAGLIGRNLIEKQISVSTREDGSIRVFLDASAEESTLFARSFDEMLSPIINQRYAIPRYETALPRGNGAFAAISAGLKPRASFIAAYHPVPDALGVNKEKAQIFQYYWNKLISRGEIVFLKGPEGEKIIEQYGMSNPLGIRKQVANFWR